MNSQRGATLAIALMLLFVITLIGVSSLKTSHIQEKMAHNVQDKMISFESAETALVGAETLIAAIPNEPIPTSIAGCPNVTVNETAICIVEYNSSFTPENTTTSWWQQNATSYAINYPSGTQTKHKVQTTPLFYIEYLKFVPDSLVIGQAPPSGIHYYRVFSYGFGTTNNSRSILESTFNRRY